MDELGYSDVSIIFYDFDLELSFLDLNLDENTILNIFNNKHSLVDNEENYNDKLICRKMHCAKYH